MPRLRPASLALFTPAACSSEPTSLGWQRQTGALEYAAASLAAASKAWKTEPVTGTTGVQLWVEETDGKAVLRCLGPASAFPLGWARCRLSLQHPERSLEHVADVELFPAFESASTTEPVQSELESALQLEGEKLLPGDIARIKSATEFRLDL